MAISGNISSTTYQVLRAGLPMNPINVAPVPLDGDDEIWPVGLILGKNADGTYLPYAEVEAVIGTGDATETDFDDQVGPIEPGSASVAAGEVAFADDGCGNLTSAGGSGVINYQTGVVAVSFTTGPASEAAVTLTYKPDPYAVLDQETDTDDADSANAVVFGPVKKSLLKVGVSAQTEPTDAILARLETRHIHAV
jgi:hypothetical protein